MLEIILTNRPDLFNQLRMNPPIGRSDHVVVTGSLSVTVHMKLLVSIRKNFEMLHNNKLFIIYKTVYKIWHFQMTQKKLYGQYFIRLYMKLFLNLLNNTSLLS